jgi:hypothetical protein
MFKSIFWENSGLCSLNFLIDGGDGPKNMEPFLLYTSLVLNVQNKPGGLDSWDKLRSRFVKKSWHYGDILCMKMMKSLDELRNLDEKYTKIHPLLHWDRDKLSRNYEISRSRRISRSRSRQSFWKCWHFLNCRDKLFDDVEIETLYRDHIKTNWDPQA